MEQSSHAEEIDMENRDPNNLNDNVKVAFEDVLGEPDGTHSIECAWRNSYKCFTCTKGCCYKFITFFCAIPMSFCWGCEFAMMSFVMIWQVTPCCRAWGIWLSCYRRFLQSVFDCCIAPFCSACGMFFNNINVTNSSA